MKPQKKIRACGAIFLLFKIQNVPYEYRKILTKVCKRKIFMWKFRIRKNIRRNNTIFLTEIIKRDSIFFPACGAIFFFKIQNILYEFRKKLTKVCKGKIFMWKSGIRKKSRSNNKILLTEIIKRYSFFFRACGADFFLLLLRSWRILRNHWLPPP